MKPIAPGTGLRDGWQLLNGDGLPDDYARAESGRDAFAVPRRIVAIHADADEIFALSDELRSYSMRWLPNPVFSGNEKHWNDKIGWPLEEPYFVTERVLAGRSASEVARDPAQLRWGIGRRNQIVGFFEDALGRSHTGGGGLTSYYYVSRDGTEIFFSDSGLPADQSHTVCGPRRGTFVIDGFDVSASTLFVINRRGEMFTRMVDFDTIGSDTMFFQYSYDSAVRDSDVIAIPGEGWLSHAGIRLVGQAKISSLVTIALNGQHNAGRELRVAGWDSAGRIGYYRKPIFIQAAGSPVRTDVSDWSFQEVPGLEIPPNRVISASETSEALGPAPGAPSRNVRFEGRLIVPGPSRPNSRGSRVEPITFTAEIPDFNLQCSPVTLRLTEGTQSVEVKLHLVEEWYHLKRNNPGRDGTPLKLMGTLEIAPGTRARVQGRLAEALDYLQPHHRRSLGLWVEATENYLVARVKSLPRSGRVPDIRLEFRRDGANFPSVEHAIRQTLVRNGFSRVALDPALRIDETTLDSFGDSAALRDLIGKNREALRLINQWVNEPAQSDARTPFYISSGGFPWVNGLFQILRWHEKIRTLSDNLGPLIAINDELSETILFSTTQDAQAAKRIILTRIAAYELRLADLAKVPPQRSTFVYRETPATAWEPFRFGAAPARVSGMMNRILALPAGCSASIEDADVVAGEVDPFAALLEISVTCGQLRTVYWVRGMALPEYLFLSSREGGPRGTTLRPLSVPVSIVLRSSDANLLEHPLEADPLGVGSAGLNGTLTVREGNYGLTYLGRTVSWVRARR